MSLEEEQPVRGPWYERYIVGIVFVFFVVMRAMDRVFYKRVLDTVPNYVSTIFNVYWPFCIQILTMILVLPYILQKRREGDLRYGPSFYLPGFKAACAAGSFSLTKLAFFSFWDQVNLALSTAPGVVLPQTMQSLLSNFALIFTACIAYFYLGSRYKIVHIIGLILIVLSECWDITVEVQTGGLGDYTDGSGKKVALGAAVFIFYVAMYIVSTVPMAISNCYKQKCLKDHDLDVMYATYISGWWQVVWGMLFYATNWIPYPSPFSASEPSQFVSNVKAAWVCFLGENPHFYTHGATSEAECYAQGTTSCGTDQDCSACVNDFICTQDPAIIWFAIYLAFNLSFNVLMLWLTKRMSAVWAAIATVVCLDLTNIFSQSSLLMGNSAQVMTYEQWMATVLASVAMIVYNLEPERNKAGQTVYAHTTADGVVPDELLRSLEGSQNPNSQAPLLA